MKNKNLDTVIFQKDKTAVVQWGSSLITIFTQTLHQEQLYPLFYLSSKSSSYEIMHCLKKLELFDTIIIPVFELNKFAAKNYGISQLLLTAIERLKKKQLIIVPSGTPYCISLFLDASVIILAYEDEPEAQRAAAGVLLKKIIPTGKLSVLL